LKTSIYAENFKKLAFKDNQSKVRNVTSNRSSDIQAVEVKILTAYVILLQLTVIKISEKIDNTIIFYEIIAVFFAEFNLSIT